MEVICLHDEAFYALIENVVARLKETHGPQQDMWISNERAMQMLNISSKTTLQTLRDERKIRFTDPQKKNILYDHQSILDHLEKHARDNF